MKRLAKPALDAGEVHAICVGGVTDQAVAARHQMASAEILRLSQLYDNRATVNQLHLFQAAEWGQNNQLVVGAVTKGDMTDLYTSQMVKRKMPARSYYDRLMLCAPLGKCPYCGFGQVSTLDHFLSKARYPSFSVLPFNLVPSCSDCNLGKGSGVIDANNQIPHPYYEVELIESEEWLFATVVETTPASVRYFARPPQTWPRDLAVRVENYFSELDLATRFAVEAASEMLSISDYLAQLPTYEMIGTHLQQMARVERQRSKNAWRAALYAALADSNWYLEDGWRPLVAL